MKRVLSIPGFFILGILIVACAQIGSPPGGPKDEDPPVAVKSSPANYSTNYELKKIKITFDEFIKLDNVFSEFTVSPPLEEKPFPLIRGKALVIDFPASDLDSLTYTLDFGQAIEDINEGNKLPNFQFVVSKLPYIDSFSVSGFVLDAYTKKPDEDLIYVQLSSNLSDTAFQTVIPSYIGRTNPEGKFNINHIAPGIYNVFALKDANNNMLFDLPSEAIAFSNEPIYLIPDSFDVSQPAIPSDIQQIDSLASDSLLPVDTSFFVNVIADSLADSTYADSALADSMQLMVYGYSFNLFSFAEAEPFQLFLDDYNRDEPEKLTLFFSEKLDKTPELKLLLPDTTGKWYHLEDNPTKDTLIYWLADSNLVSKDSILVEITHPETDTTGELISVTDTLLFRSKVKKEKVSQDESRRGGILSRLVGGDKEEKDSLVLPVYRFKLTHNINSSGHDLNVPIQINTQSPVLEHNPDLLELVKMDDTVEVPVKYAFLPDSNHFRKFKIETDFEPATTYRLKLHEGVLTDIYKRTIDSTVFSFNTQRDDYYGKIIMNMVNISEPTIVQLLDDKEKVLKSFRIYENKKIKFDFLHPGKYMMKVIYDENDNGKWDTGIFEERIQPEHVEYFKDVVEVKSNLEFIFQWELTDTVLTTRPEEGGDAEEEED